MNYRIYCWRKPVKRVQLLPTDLSSKYPDSLQPSFLLVWCWKILLAAENAGLALATWWRRQIQMGQQDINDRSQRLAMQARTRRYGEVLNGWLSWAFRTAWHGLITLGHSDLRTSPSRTHVISSRLRSSRAVARQSLWNPPASRFEAYSTDRRSLRLSSPRERDVSQESTDEEQTRLVEELLANEEELTRVTTRIVRLQRLIHAQKHLFAKMAPTDENPAQSRQFPAETADSLVEIGKSPGRGKVRNMSLFGGTKRFPRSREPQTNEA